MKIVIYIIIYGASILLLMLYYRNKLRIEKENSICSMENKIIKEILDLSIDKTTQSSSGSILKVLRKYYRLDYCTILVNKERLVSIASNVDSLYLKYVEDYCNKILNEMKDKAKGKIVSSDHFLDYTSASERKVKYSYLIPLKQHEVIGAIYIENKEDYKENQFEMEFFKVVIKNISTALQNCIYQDEINNLAMRDNLTKLYNRNYMQLDLQQRIRNNNSFVIGMLDIDNFKSCNDKYGHDFGDLVLIEISHFIKNAIRDYDEIYRWGGEEFIIFFDNTTCKDIYPRLDIIRAELSKHNISKDNISINITASFGIVEFPKYAHSIDELINCADKALYQSKSNGKNKITVYENIKS